MRQRSSKILIQSLIAALVTGLVWYGQANFNVAADYALRADFFASQGQLALAQDYYEQALHYEPENITNRFHLGMVYGENGQYAEAFTVLKQAYEMGYENRFLVQYQMGRAAYYQLDYPTATLYFESALLQLDMTAPNYAPDTHATLLTLLGWSYWHELGCTVAVPYFQAATQLSTEIGLARSGLRRCS
jgi:tetratricopeptide (TPR) repeat protein